MDKKIINLPIDAYENGYEVEIDSITFIYKEYPVKILESDELVVESWKYEWVIKPKETENE